MDRRFLIIEERDSLTFPRDLLAYHVVYLPVDYDTDLDEVTAAIRATLSEYGVTDGYSITDRRSWFEQGASAAEQEIILALAMAILGGTVEAILGSLLQSLLSRTASHSNGQEALPLNTDHMLGVAERYLKDNCGAIGNLRVISSSTTDRTLTALIQDSHGTRYQVSMEGNYMEPGGRLDVTIVR